MSGERPLPCLRSTATGSQLIVDGQPVLLLGGQLHNSSPSSPEYMETIWDRLAGMGIRTVIGAASWAQVEPVEGSFDFSTVDAQVEAARARGLRLVLIWFGAFKNAASTYAPGWVRRDVGRYPRALATGTDTALFTYPGAMSKPVLKVFSTWTITTVWSGSAVARCSMNRTNARRSASSRSAENTVSTGLDMAPG